MYEWTSGEFAVGHYLKLLTSMCYLGKHY